MSSKKMIKELSFGKRRDINAMIQPFYLLDSDPVQAKLILKSIKVLTNSTRALILRLTINRKDDKMATKKIETNYMQIGSIGVLVIAAALGVTSELGGGLRASVVAAVLVVCLGAYAIDYRK